MKKILTVLLSLLLVAAVFPTSAEGMMGVQLEFPDYGFSIVYPAEWYSMEVDPIDEESQTGYLFIGTNEEETRWIYSYVEPANGDSLDDLQAELAEDSSYYTNLQRYLVGEIELLMYEVEEDGFFAAAMLSKDGKSLVFFEFEPLEDKTMGELASQIIGTLAYLD